MDLRARTSCVRAAAPWEQARRTRMLRWEQRNIDVSVIESMDFEGIVGNESGASTLEDAEQ